MLTQLSKLFSVTGLKTAELTFKHGTFLLLNHLWKFSMIYINLHEKIWKHFFFSNFHILFGLLDRSSDITWHQTQKTNIIHASVRFKLDNIYFIIH